MKISSETDYVWPNLHLNIKNISQSLFTVQHVMWVDRSAGQSSYIYSLEHHSIYPCEAAQKGKSPLKNRLCMAKFTFKHLKYFPIFVHRPTCNVGA